MPGTTFSADNWTGYDSATSDTIASVTGFSFIINVANLSATWKSNVQSDGADIRITKSDGTTELAYDLIDWAYNAGSPTGWIRVLFSGASGTTVTVRVWSGYTGGTATAYDATETYGSDNAYDAYWEGYLPLHDLLDRTSNNLDGTAYGDAALGAQNKVVGAYDFDGENDSIDLGTSPAAGLTALTVLVWVRQDATSNDRMVAEDGDAYNKNAFFVNMSEGAPSVLCYEPAPWSNFNSKTHGTAISAGTWAHVGLRWETSVEIGLYVDGVASSATAGGSTLTHALITGNTNLVLGGRASTSYPSTPTITLDYDGHISEFQIHSAARSADWIATEYAQTNDNAGFWNTWSWTAYSGGGLSIPIAHRYYANQQGR